MFLRRYCLAACRLRLCSRGSSRFFSLCFVFFAFFRILLRFRKSFFLAEDLHEFLTGDGFFFDQVSRQFIHDLTVLFEQFLRLLIAVTQKLHNLRINIRRRHLGTGQRCPAVQILTFHRSKTHQSEFLAHTEAGDHIAGYAGRLFNIIGRPCRDGIKHNLLCRPAAKQSYQPVTQFRFRIQILLFFRHMHDITQGTHGSGHDGDLLYRLGILLQCADQRMADFMIGNDLAFFLAHDPVFLLFSYEYLLYRVKKILLAHILSACLNGIDCRLVDHICEIGSHRAGSRQRNFVQIHRFIHPYIFGMYLQDLHSSF